MNYKWEDKKIEKMVVHSFCVVQSVQSVQTQNCGHVSGILGEVFSYVETTSKREGTARLTLAVPPLTIKHSQAI